MFYSVQILSKGGPLQARGTFRRGCMAGPCMGTTHHALHTYTRSEQCPVLTTVPCLVPAQVIWLAAHMDRQLKRQQVFDTSIPFTVDAIIKPQVGIGIATTSSTNAQLYLFKCRCTGTFCWQTAW